MVRMLILVSAIALSGCGKPDVAACESYLKKKLKSPATYQRVDVKSYDEGPMTLDAFRTSMGLLPTAQADELGKLDSQLLKGRKISKRQVFVTYDAANAFGTPIRGIEVCTFRLADGELEPADRLESYAGQAALDDQMRELAASGAIAPSAVSKSPPPVGGACCISRH
ncbi:MAG: hypothetical protein JWO16_1481 [Sphingomonas bacterium]|nr:hypothetical protein [Sphingomonas bacterium]